MIHAERISKEDYKVDIEGTREDIAQEICMVMQSLSEALEVTVLGLTSDILTILGLNGYDTGIEEGAGGRYGIQTERNERAVGSNHTERVTERAVHYRRS